MTTQEQTDLEMLVDRHGLFAVLDSLSGICGGKAEHLRGNWQDENAARDWEKAESAVDRAASKVLDLF